ncbi:MAG: hypothetical protein WC939_03075 [Acholeplasmataceae bacterium]|jgi:hypothetical protein
MATYKKGYKKQNTELMLLKTIIAIIASVVLIVAIAFIYDALTKWSNYSSYPSIENYEDVFEMKDEDENEIMDYVIYIYSNNSETSSDIKKDVLKLGRSINKENDMFFLIDSGNITSDEEAEFGEEEFLDTINRDRILTPMIVVVNDGEFHQAYYGSTDVLETLESIEDGTYEPFN